MLRGFRDHYVARLARTQRNAPVVFRVQISRPVSRGLQLCRGSADEEQATSTVLAGAQQRPEPADNVLFVTSLPKNTDDAGLAELAEGQAGLQQAYMFRKAVGNWVGYLLFDSAQSAAAARESLHKKYFGGKTVQVRVHRTNEDTGSKQRTRRNSNSNKQKQQQPDDASSSGGSAAASSADPGQQPQNKQQGEQRPAARDSPAVYVGNLAWATLAEDLREHFSTCSGVVDAILLMTRDGKPSGSGFVLFDSSEAAAAAVQKMHDTQLDGRTIVVKPAKERSRRGAAAPPPPAAAADAAAEPGASAASEPNVGLQRALAGAAEDERRVVVRNGPDGFGWRDYRGMCSVFGEVVGVDIIPPAGAGAGTDGKGATAAAGSQVGGEGAGGGSGGAGRQKLPFAVVRMADRAAAEAVVEGLYARSVQGNKLVVMLYKQKQQRQAHPGKVDARSSGSEGSEGDAVSGSDAAGDAAGETT